MGNYNKLLEKAKGVYKTCTTDTERKVIESIFPEFKESEDEKIRREILDYFKDLDEHGYSTKEWTAWVEKHGKNDSQAIVPTFTFDDVLALECCMKEVEKDEKLYNQLKSLYNRVHDAYWLDNPSETCQYGKYYVRIAFSTGPYYLIKNEHNDENYRKAQRLFSEMWRTIISYGPDACDSHNHGAYFEIHSPNAVKIWNEIDGIVTKYRDKFSEMLENDKEAQIASLQAQIDKLKNS